MSPAKSNYWLRTPRIGFGLWTDTDQQLAREIYGDDELTALIGGPFAEADVLARVHTQVANQREHGVQHWPVHLLATDENIGICGFRPYTNADDVLELGFIFRKPFWAQGFAPEAARAAIAHARSVLQPARICAGHHPDNLRSGKVLTKLGFAYSHHEIYPLTGLEHPMYFLAESGAA
jgi:[ribosomal protein S5]-alanine N-acetyltransferase